MSKKSKQSIQNKFIPCATDEQIKAAEARLNTVKRAGRKPKKRKVEAVTETVIRLLSEGKSSRRTSDLVLHIHNYSIKKDSIRRFKNTLPHTTFD